MTELKKGDYLELQKDIKNLNYEKGTLWLFTGKRGQKASLSLVDKESGLTTDKFISGPINVIERDFLKLDKLPFNVNSIEEISKKGALLELTEDYNLNIDKKDYNFKKGTRAVIVKGGKSIHLKISQETESDLVISTGLSVLSKFKLAEPKQEKELEQWKVKSNKSFDTHDGYAFEMVLTHAGKKAATVYNGGYGGPDEIEFVNKDFERKYEEILENTSKKVGEKVDIDTLNAYFFENEKGLRTFEEYAQKGIDDLKRFMDEHKKDTTKKNKLKP